MYVQLSARQRECVRLRALGLSNDEVGLRLDLALGTVKRHVQVARQKCRVGTFPEMLSALGWLTVPDE